MGRPITRRQLEVLTAFQQLQLEQGLAPTLEELGQSLGVNRVTVYGHIQSLAQKGYLENLFPGASRGLDITELGHQTLPKIQTEISMVHSENAIPEGTMEVSPEFTPEPTLPLLGKLQRVVPWKPWKIRPKSPCGISCPQETVFISLKSLETP